MADTLTLWSDEPTDTDLLSFTAVAETIGDGLLKQEITPIAIGLSGKWGSGKTTVLKLIEHDLTSRSTDAEKVLIIRTDPWRYDPTTGAKESLIGEVLAALQAELKQRATLQDKTKKLLGRLIKRVDWGKTLKITAKAAIAWQVPSFDDVTSIIKDNPDNEDDVHGMDAFRDEFNELMKSDDLQYVRQVVVLVDDLDRCLPDTVVETLEAIRLFLAVDKMSFVLAADEERVAEAIGEKFPAVRTSAPSDDAYMEESPASLYLHKIVQTTIPLPSLSRFDTEAYVLLLLLMQQADAQPHLPAFIEQCSGLRFTSKGLDELSGVSGVDIEEQRMFAARITPLLYEKLRGNPRRLKRFLNDLFVRKAVAERRGITLDTEVVAKLMLLELLLKPEFSTLLGWLAKGILRDKIGALETAAGPGVGDTTPAPTDEEPEQPASAQDADEFSNGMIRWTKLPPSLTDIDLTPYLTLAASFRGEPLLDTGLPEHLQDLAANMISEARVEQLTVRDEDIRGLTGPDSGELVQYLGRIARDRPTAQRHAITSLLRIARLRGEHENVLQALKTIPFSAIGMPVLLLFGTKDQALRPALEKWNEDGTDQGAKRTALQDALGKVSA